MAAWKLAPALTCGNTVVLKLAEQTPLTGLRLAELINEAGFPAGVVNVLTGYGEGAGAPLAAHDLVDKVAFTGSTEVGKLIVHAAAGNLKKVSLELGGKSPAIVFPDAKIDQAIQGTASAIFFNHGQCCCAGSRLYIHEKVFDRVVEGVSNVASDIKLAPGMDPACQMGPLVSDEQYRKVVSYIESGISEGAKVAAGGPVSGHERGYFVRPTVLTNTNPRMKVAQEEIFGPVVCAVPFSDADVDAIIKRANDTIYGLAASVWTQNISLAHKVARGIRAGTVWVNCHNVFDASLPFGGYKQSGWGREMGEEVLQQLHRAEGRHSGVVDRWSVVRHRAGFVQANPAHSFLTPNPCSRSLPYSFASMRRPWVSWSGRELILYNRANVCHWERLMLTGCSNTNQRTPSVQGGAVSDPIYVQ